MFFRTYTCGRSTKSTNSYILYHAMDVSLYHCVFSLKIIRLLWILSSEDLTWHYLFRPTNEFPHPLSRVKQPAGYRVSLLFYFYDLWKKELLLDVLSAPKWSSPSNTIWEFVRRINITITSMVYHRAKSIKIDHFRKWRGMNELLKYLGMQYLRLVDWL